MLKKIILKAHLTQHFAIVNSILLYSLCILLIAPTILIADQTLSLSNKTKSDRSCFGNKKVSGAILIKYYQLGSCKSFLGAPKTGVNITSDKKGRYVHFEYGSIFWHLGTKKAFEIHGAIKNKWIKLGGERSALGYPITDETTAPDGKGRFSRFQHGSIYYHPSTGNAYEIHGDILKSWAKLKYEHGSLGYPTSDETKTPDGVGRFNHFQHGSIYWTPKTGAHAVYGSIHKKWASLGYERSNLGYPVNGEKSEGPKTRYSAFQNGVIYWSSNTGIHIVMNETSSSQATKDRKDDPL